MLFWQVVVGGVAPRLCWAGHSWLVGLVWQQAPLVFVGAAWHFVCRCALAVLAVAAGSWGCGPLSLEVNTRVWRRPAHLFACMCVTERHTPHSLLSCMCMRPVCVSGAFCLASVPASPPLHLPTDSRGTWCFVHGLCLQDNGPLAVARACCASCLCVDLLFTGSCLMSDACCSTCVHRSGVARVCVCRECCAEVCEAPPYPA